MVLRKGHRAVYRLPRDKSLSGYNGDLSVTSRGCPIPPSRLREERFADLEGKFDPCLDFALASWHDGGMTNQHPTARGWSGLTAREIVHQSLLCHPDWDIDTHIAYLMHEEGINLEHLAGEGDRGPRETVGRWLAELRHPCR